MVGRAMVLAVTALVTVGAWAQPDEPLIAIDIPSVEPQFSFGDWMEGALRDDPVRVRWPHLQAGGELPPDTACVVTWSDPERRGGEARRLREFVRDGGGIVYVIGEGRPHLRHAREFLGPLEVDVREVDGGAGAAEWVAHPLTEGSPALGAVSAGYVVSGVGANPLIRAGGRQVAVAFDWGPLGRAVIIDHSVLFDQLHQSSPRPAVRDFLVRAVLWAARADEDATALPDAPEDPEIPSIEELIGQNAVSEIEHSTAVIDLPDDRGANWPALRELLLEELERAGLEVDEPILREGRPLLDADELERAGLVVLGPSREDEEVHWSEPLALGWYFNRGGRILAIPHADGGTIRRMIGFNKLLTQLRIAASLEREAGQARVVPHVPTEDAGAPPDGRRVRGGAHVWAPLTDPLVEVRGRPAAVAWQLGEGRIVVIDGQLLLAQGGQDEPFPEMVAILRNAVQWLTGEL